VASNTESALSGYVDALTAVLMKHSRPRTFAPHTQSALFANFRFSCSASAILRFICESFVGRKNRCARLPNSFQSCCSLFTGASVYVSLVEHPARTQCGVEIATTQFAPSYRRATVMQVTSAGLGLVSSVAAWLAGATFWS
jgi:hypothetical protein